MTAGLSMKGERKSSMKEKLLSYFLGKLSEQEQIEVEEEYFSDDAKYQEFEAFQTQLLDDYVQGKLSAQEHRDFEKYVKSSPGLGQRVLIAKLLSDKVSKIETESVSTKELPQTRTVHKWYSLFSRTNFKSFTNRYALLFLGVSVVLLLFYIGSLPKKELQNASELQIILEPSLHLRGDASSPKEIEVSSKTTRINLKMTFFQKTYHSFQVNLKTLGGLELWQQKDLTANKEGDKSFISVKIDTKLLKSDDYVLTLVGVDDGSVYEIEKYLFSVHKLSK